ncbi:MAG TPA: hypothetical protein VHR35_04400 [Nocardioides sp.]|jgi:hypothetical protein|nr:hypothetical protein [Nocardioides sp.]
MSHRRHSWAAVAVSMAALTVLSGCFGSDPQEPTAAHHTGRHSRATEPTVTTDPTSSVATSQPPTTAPPTSLLRFSPRSGGKHLDDCQRLVPGDDPAEFLYYPVLVRASAPVTLDSVGDLHTTQGVVLAGSWVAPSAPTGETGTVKGWPPGRIVTGDPNLRWNERVTASGATLDPSAGWYNVFLRLQVDPTPGDSATTGLVFGYHDATGPHTDTWVARTTFSMSC